MGNHMNLTIEVLRDLANEIGHLMLPSEAHKFIDFVESRNAALKAPIPERTDPTEAIKSLEENIAETEESLARIPAERTENRQIIQADIDAMRARLAALQSAA